MTHTSTEQPEALPNDQFFQLWQAYCDKKSECEDLRERIAELEASQAQRVPLTDDQISDLNMQAWKSGGNATEKLARLVERAHGITQEQS